MTIRRPFRAARALFTLLLPGLALLAWPTVATAQPANPEAQTQPAPPPSIQNPRLPSLSADAQKIAFTWHGDIFTVPVEGGRAHRVTMHEAHDSTPVWSPDGSKIAFASNREYGYDVWIVDATGGTPTQITFDSGVDIPLKWLADGQSLLTLSSREGGLELWRVPINGATPVRLTFFGARDGDVSADGQNLVFARANGTGDAFQLRYAGSANHDLWLQSLVESDSPVLPAAFTSTQTNEFDPHFTADGQAIVFRGEEGGTYNIWRKNIDGTGAEQLTNLDDGVGIDSLEFNAAHNLALVTRDFRIWSVNLDGTAPATLQPIGIDVQEDPVQPATINKLVNKGSKQGDARGDTLVFELDGDIYSTPVGGGLATKVVGTRLVDEWPRLSPDGTMLGFQVNNGGNQDIYVMTLRDKQLHRMTSHNAADAYFAWSPDSTQIVFASERSGDREVWVMPVNGGDSQAKQLTRSRGSDDDPTFAPDGRIVFDSARGGTQDIWIMDADGGNPRVLFATQAFEQVARVSPDGQWVVFESFTQGAQGKPDIRFGSINGGDSMSLGNGNAPFFSPDGEFVIYEADVAGGTSLVRVKNPKAVATPEIIPMIAQIEKTQTQQFSQLADEAFNALKSGFYDPGFHGRDWDKIRARYAPVISQSGTTEEMANLLNRAIGELGASHQGYYASSEYSRANVGTGRIGATLQLETIPGAEGDAAVRGLKLLDVVPGGPADKSWLRKGDWIRAVNGKPVQHINFYRMLTGQRQVTLTVSSSTDVDSTRDVQIELINDGQLRALEYAAWEEKNQKAVTSGGNDLAYVHLTGMNPENLQKIVAYLSGPAKDKAGLVLDVRNNGGGHLHNQLMDIFNRQPFGQYRPRNGKEAWEPGLTWTKPVVLLINERSFSDAEVFPAAFKSVNRGPVIGVRTPGGVIGTHDIQLSDGSTLRIPTVGWFRTNGENMEGNGCEPDVEVPLTVEDEQAGRDPQLGKAIETLRELINKAKSSGSTPDDGGSNGANGGGSGTQND